MRHPTRQLGARAISALLVAIALLSSFATVQDSAVQVPGIHPVDSRTTVAVIDPGFATTDLLVDDVAAITVETADERERCVASS